jgi:hypothetical protein
LAFGDDLVFALEVGSGFAEGFFVAHFTVAGLAAQLQIPILGEVLAFPRLSSLVETRRFLTAR